MSASASPALPPTPTVLGQKSGTVLVNDRAAIGEEACTIILGNPYPQNTRRQGVVVGAQVATPVGNAADGNEIRRSARLADNAKMNSRAPSASWKAKITQLGSSFVGGFAVADSRTQWAATATRITVSRRPTTSSRRRWTSATALVLLDPSGAVSRWRLTSAGFDNSRGRLPAMLAFQQLERGPPRRSSIDCSGAAITRSSVASFIRANNTQIKLGRDYGVALT